MPGCEEVREQQLSQQCVFSQFPVARTQFPSLRSRALLNFKEYVKIGEGAYELIEYSYHYQRLDGYFFRYDKVRSARAAECNEPECHLHANIEDIRFPTHSTNLEEILETIQRNFYR